MIYHSINVRDLSPYFLKAGTSALLKCYARSAEDSPRTKKRGAVIVLHGGGYHMKSVAEGEPVALRFLAEGYQTFALEYSLLPARHPQQLFELAACVAYLRKNAEMYQIDPGRIALCGFSAGAHLAALLANKWGDTAFFEPLGLAAADVRPNAVILSYPPTTPDLADCRPMFVNILGGAQDEAKLLDVSPLHGVSGGNPPTFLWHTGSDPMVSPQHTLLYAEALRVQGVPFELHVFPEGPHAMALCDEETAYSAEYLQPQAAQWFPLAVNWLGAVNSNPGKD